MGGSASGPKIKAKSTEWSAKLVGRTETPSLPTGWSGERWKLPRRAEPRPQARFGAWKKPRKCILAGINVVSFTAQICIHNWSWRGSPPSGYATVVYSILRLRPRCKSKSLRQATRVYSWTSAPRHSSNAIKEVQSKRTFSYPRDRTRDSTASAQTALRQKVFTQHR